MAKKKKMNMNGSKKATKKAKTKKKKTKKSKSKKAKKPITKSQASQFQKQRPRKEQIRDAKTTSKSLISDDRFLRDPTKFDFPEVDTLNDGVSKKAVNQGLIEQNKQVIFIEDLLKDLQKNKKRKLTPYEVKRLTQIYKVKGRSKLTMKQKREIVRKKLMEDKQKIRSTNQTLYDVRFVKPQTPSERKIKKELIKQIIQIEKDYVTGIEQEIKDVTQKLSKIETKIQKTEVLKQHSKNDNDKFFALNDKLVRLENKQTKLGARLTALTALTLDSPYRTINENKTERTRRIQKYEKQLREFSIEELRLEKLKQKTIHKRRQKRFDIEMRKVDNTIRKKYIDFVGDYTQKGKDQQEILDKSKEKLKLQLKEDRVLANEIKKLQQIPTTGDLRESLRKKEIEDLTQKQQQQKQKLINNIILREQQWENTLHDFLIRANNQVNEKYRIVRSNQSSLESLFRSSKKQTKRKMTAKKELFWAKSQYTIALREQEVIEKIYKQNVYRKPNINNPRGELAKDREKFEESLQKASLKYLSLYDTYQRIKIKEEFEYINEQKQLAENREQDRWITFIQSREVSPSFGNLPKTVENERTKLSIMKRHYKDTLQGRESKTETRKALELALKQQKAREK